MAATAFASPHWPCHGSHYIVIIFTQRGISRDESDDTDFAIAVGRASDNFNVHRMVSSQMLRTFQVDSPNPRAGYRAHRHELKLISQGHCIQMGPRKAKGPYVLIQRDQSTADGVFTHWHIDRGPTILLATHALFAPGADLNGCNRLHRMQLRTFPG